MHRVEWKVLRRLDGILQGDYRSLLRGFGMDLADLREYQASDDVRFIDWNVTARMNTPYVREFEEDRDLCAWFLVDRSASMEFGSAGFTKRELASELIAVLARLLTRHGNPVGALLYNQVAQRSEFLKPRHGRGQAIRLVSATLNPLPNASGTQPGQEQLTNLARLLDAGRQLARRRSMVFVVSDFIAQSGWEKNLQLLHRAHEVVAVRITDPFEQQLPDAGSLTLQDPETGELLWVDLGDKAFRSRFAQEAQRREQELAGKFRAMGIDCLSLSTDQDLAAELIRFCKLRRQRRRRA